MSSIFLRIQQQSIRCDSVQVCKKFLFLTKNTNNNHCSMICYVYLRRLYSIQCCFKCDTFLYDKAHGLHLPAFSYPFHFFLVNRQKCVQWGSFLFFNILWIDTSALSNKASISLFACVIANSNFISDLGSSVCSIVLVARRFITGLPWRRWCWSHILEVD
jgi:hypothetical protein